MHQEHNIPWNKAASHLKFIRDDNPLYYPPPVTRIFPRNLPTQGQELNHFVRVLSKTIKTFADTERAKYEASFDAPSSGLLFSDKLREKYPEYLTTRHQRIESWIAAAQAAASPAFGQIYYYDTRHGELADVVKILIAENEMPTLLMLARHPKIPLSSLRNLSWGHSFGFARVVEAALQCYLFVNLASAMGILHNGEYLELPQYGGLVRDLTWPMDHPAQQLPHRIFLEALPKDPKSSLPEIHRNLSQLHEYLKDVFKLMFRTEVVLRECGTSIDWEQEIVGCFRFIICGGIRITKAHVRRFV
jgi:hypothetical protein